ncbi:hypothetical protein G3T36_17780 [Diaminobutyricibacter tongyongensis]|uniref:Uncharacterized protein n=1 Tax=Leifsonia tongyongensis TaxID=1268043 RepID=A0A6L9Y1Z1_9MICO|nr:hypothetical protein [Diaminobutyricibacter tongyongensis]NEN07709.1 hypothetical protein [Diaminobutyricibacter tongyongensis]
MNEERKDEPIGEFDQTNDKAPGLDGDDAGALPDEDDQEHGVLTDLVRDLDSNFEDRKDDDGETAYSEEGRP